MFQNDIESARTAGGLDGSAAASETTVRRFVSPHPSRPPRLPQTRLKHPCPGATWGDPPSSQSGMADEQPKWSRGPGRSFADIRNGAGMRGLNPSHPKYREDSYAREMSDVAKERESAFRANDAKERGNECLAEGNFRAAIQFYTTAINQHHAPEQHVYYSNRAAAHIRLQQWDEALADAERCVLVRPDWGKGYFRKGGRTTRHASDWRGGRCVSQRSGGRPSQ